VPENRQAVRMNVLAASLLVRLAGVNTGLGRLTRDGLLVRVHAADIANTFMCPR